MKITFKKMGVLFSIVFSVVVNATSDNTSILHLPYYDSASFTPKWLTPDSPELETFHKIPAFTFSNQDGEIINQAIFENKIYVANFFFSTCPGICPDVKSKLERVQNSYLNDEDVLIISHSIRPSTDTTDILKAYAQENDIVSGKWHLATGNRDMIYELAKTHYFADEDLGEIENSDRFLHTENLVLIDHNKHIRGIYNGLNATSVNHLIDDIKLLKAELKSDS